MGTPFAWSTALGRKMRPVNACRSPGSRTPDILARPETNYRCWRTALMPPPPERRDHPRIKVKVPVELHFEDNDTPYRCATSDLSLFGCYIETMFPFPVDTPVELKLQASAPLLILGKIVTSDPQVGNGIQFIKMLPEDIEELRAFLEAIEKEAAEKEAAEKEAAEKRAEEKKP